LHKNLERGLALDLRKGKSILLAFLMLYQNRLMINGLFLITGRPTTLSTLIYCLIRTQKSEFLSLSEKTGVKA